LNNITKAYKHFLKICKHKHYVRKYCWKVGLYRQGIMHDMSKFSPTEFFEGVKYYQGTDSPINACKADKGWSAAWMHHKGRNKHHYEYWQDNFDNGGEPILMPYKYVLEQLCDYLGAGRAYMGKDFTYQKEYEWWLNRSKNPMAMHPVAKIFTTDTLETLAAKSRYGEKYAEDFLKTFDFKEYYNLLVIEYREKIRR
jgi:hypothetical protein